jgi:arsenate reductase
MAEGWMKYFFKNEAEVYSGGVEKHGVNPTAVKVMAEVGVDISSNTSDLVYDFLGIDFDFVLTVCENAKENCPVFPNRAQKVHKSFEDPAKAKGTEEEILDKFRHIRDEIKKFCVDFSTNNLE